MNRTNVKFLLACVLLLALVMLTHPYAGIWHDAKLYAVQGLRWLSPQNYAEDLFFKYGSQDDFTLFSIIYAALIEQAGLYLAAFIVTLIGLALVFSGALFFAFHYLTGTARWYLALLLCTIPTLYYGGYRVFGFFEAFATPRGIAMGFGLFGLGWLVRGRWVTSGVSFTASLLLHPIMALGALGLGWLLLPSRRLRWWLLGLGGLGFVVLALWVGDPFSRLYQTMDEEWASLVRRHVPYLVPAEWRVHDWIRLGLALTGMAAGWLVSGDRLRPVFGAAFILFLAGVSLAQLGWETHNLLLIQAQPWRVLWLAPLMGLLGLARFAQATESSIEGRLTILALVLAWIWQDPVGLSAGLGALALWRLTRGRAEWQYLKRLEWLAYLVPLFFLTLKLLAYQQTSLSPRRLLHQFFVQDAALALLLGLTGLLLLRATSRYSAPLLGMLAASMVGLALAAADPSTLRNDVRKDYQQVFAQAQQRIPEDAVVFWPDGDINIPWQNLRRSYYIHPQQTASILYSRQNTLVAKSRMDFAQMAGISRGMGWDWRDELRVTVRGKASVDLAEEPTNQGPAGSESHTLAVADKKQLTAFSAQVVCKDPVLDFLLGLVPVEGLEPYADIVVNEARLLIYACHDLRGGGINIILPEAVSEARP
ncbi:MAG: hypothetical protein ABFS23_08040 [Pseudomonadota bacterium]